MKRTVTNNIRFLYVRFIRPSVTVPLTMLIVNDNRHNRGRPTFQAWLDTNSVCTGFVPTYSSLNSIASSTSKDFKRFNGFNWQLSMLSLSRKCEICVNMVWHLWRNPLFLKLHFLMLSHSADLTDVLIIVISVWVLSCDETMRQLIVVFILFVLFCLSVFLFLI